MCGHPERAEDAEADAFVKVWRAWRGGRIDNPRAYIRRAVVNTVNSRFRRLALERREAERRTGDQRGPERSEERLVQRDELVEALEQLPRRQRTAVVLRYWEDLSEVEAAEAMDVSPGTVKSSVSRGLARLRELVDYRGDELMADFEETAAGGAAGSGGRRPPGADPAQGTGAQEPALARRGLRRSGHGRCRGGRGGGARRALGAAYRH